MLSPCFFYCSVISSEAKFFLKLLTFVRDDSQGSCVGLGYQQLSSSFPADAEPTRKTLNSFFNNRNLRLHAFALQFLEEHLMNPRWLLVERDHLVQLGAKPVLAVLGTAPAHGEMTQHPVSGVEMPVIHQIAGRIDRSRLDLEARALLAFAPHHRESFALRNANDRARAVAMKRAPASRSEE